MANTKTSALPALTGANTATGDLIPIDDVSVTTLKNITIAELALALITLGNLTTDAELASALAAKQDAATAATDAELAAHTGAGAGAHAAAAITIADAGNDFTATTVEGALDELQADAETTAGQLFTHITVATDAHDASAVSVADTGAHYAGTQVESVLDEVGDVIELTMTMVNDHIADTTGAHGASSIANVPTGTVTSSNVQAAINELATLISGGGIPATLVDAAGDLIVGTADNTVARFAKGANNTALTTSGTGVLAWANPNALPQVANPQTGTTYTFVLADAGKLVTASNAAVQTYTVPPASSVAYAPGTTIDIAAYGAGQVVIAPGAGVTIQTSSTLKLRTQWSAATLVLSATADQWVLVGDLEPLGQAINAQTGTTYTFVLSDSEKLVTSSNAATQTFTVPANATTAFPIGTHIDIIQTGVGQLIIAPDAAVTINSTPTLKARARYSGMTLVKAATNGWYLMGDLAAT